MATLADWFAPNASTASWFPQPSSGAAASGTPPALPPEAIQQVLALLLGIPLPKSSATADTVADSSGDGGTGGGTSSPAAFGVSPGEMGGPAIGAAQFAMGSPTVSALSSLMSGNLAGAIGSALNAALGGVSPSFNIGGPFGLNFSVNPGTMALSHALSALGVPGGFGLSGFPGMIGSIAMNAATNSAANALNGSYMAGVGEEDPTFGLTPAGTLADLNATGQNEGQMAALQAAYALMGLDPAVLANAALTGGVAGFGINPSGSPAIGANSPGFSLGPASSGTPFSGAAGTGGTSGPAPAGFGPNYGGVSFTNTDGSVTSTAPDGSSITFGPTTARGGNEGPPGEAPGTTADATGIAMGIDTGNAPGPAPGDAPGAPGSEGAPGPGTAGPAAGDAPGPGPGDAGGSGGGGGAGDGGSVICSELYRQGLMDKVTWIADEQFGRLLPRETLIGYQIWARPVAQAMAKSPLLTALVALAARPWVHEMAYQMGARSRGSWIGRVMMKLGVPVCTALSSLITSRLRFTTVV